MSKKSTWADVKKYDVVELGGREWRVIKIKAGKKKAEVTVDYKGRIAESTVKLADRVRIAKKGDGTKRGPLHDETNAQRRWATKRELEDSLGKGLPAGDPSVTKPPTKAKHGDPWESQTDRIEKSLNDLLSARLVGISTDEDSGYYVPPVNVTTVASHLALFHGGIPAACEDDEKRMLSAHESQHAEALRGMPLAVNHWHTPTRPKIGA